MKLIGSNELQNAKDHRPVTVVLYSWFTDGKSGDVTCKFFDTADDTWVSEAVTPLEAVLMMRDQNVTMTPGAGSDMDLEDLSGESGENLLYQIVRGHMVTCDCEPCAKWDVCQREV